jgi:hypothetical protein
MTVSIVSFFIGIISIVSLAFNDQALPVLALLPPVSSSTVMLHDLLFDHPLDLGVEIVSDPHEVFFRDYDLIDG